MTASRALQASQESSRGSSGRMMSMRVEPSNEQQQLQQQQLYADQYQQHQPHRTNTSQVNYRSRQTVASSPSSSISINTQSGPYRSSATTGAAQNQFKTKQQQQSSTSNSPFTSARSTTPLSRPGSSVFGTPISGANAQQTMATATTGTTSACSNASTTLDQQSASSSSGSSLGKCRICRKIILANELCHLCSNCNQFICEDCASYSSSDKVS